MEVLLLAYTRHFPVRFLKYRLVEAFGRWVTRSEQRFQRRARLKYGNYIMDCDLRKMLQRQFYFFGTYILEDRILAEWGRYAETSRVVLDVGANVGIFSLVAAASSPLAKIHAFEPTPEIAAHFRNTLAQNSLGERVTLHQIAVTRETGTAHLNFFTGEYADNEGMNFVTTKGQSSKSLAIHTISLDDFCSNAGLTTIDLVKIDVQGNEPGVLAGAGGLLRRKAIKTLFLELNWDRADRGHCPASEVLYTLGQAGYAFADPRLPNKFRPAGLWLKDLSEVIVAAD